jgi:hypothetical protein
VSELPENVQQLLWVGSAQSEPCLQSCTTSVPVHDVASIVAHAAAVVQATVLPEALHGKVPPVTVTVAQQTGVGAPHPAGESQGWPPSPKPPLLEPELEPLLEPELEPLLEPELEPLLEPELEVDPLLEPELDPLLPPDPELEPDEDPELELELESLLESAPESAPPLPPVLLLLLHDVATKKGPMANAKMPIERLRMAHSSLDHGSRSAAIVNGGSLGRLVRPAG